MDLSLYSYNYNARKPSRLKLVISGSCHGDDWLFNFPDDVPKIFVGNMTPEEIEAQTREMYYKNDGIWICHQCGKTANVHCNMRFHVETHMDGLCYPCNICSKEFRSKNSLNTHKVNKKCQNFHKSS